MPSRSTSPVGRDAATLTVLIVDDDQDVRRIANVVLGEVASWVVLVASCAQDGLEIARRGRPDVVLLDLSMPNEDGPDLMTALRGDPQTATIPVILLTARQREDPLVSASLASGAVGLISKPFEPLLLAEKIQDMLAGSRA